MTILLLALEAVLVLENDAQKPNRPNYILF